MSLRSNLSHLGSKVIAHAQFCVTAQTASIGLSLIGRLGWIIGERVERVLSEYSIYIYIYTLSVRLLWRSSRKYLWPFFSAFWKWRFREDCEILRRLDRIHPCRRKSPRGLARLARRPTTDTFNSISSIRLHTRQTSRRDHCVRTFVKETITSRCTCIGIILLQRCAKIYAAGRFIW